MDSPSAFPNQPLGTDGLPEAQASPGMTLRDWFAGQALGWPDTGGLSPSEAAEYAYEYADAMLAERSKAKAIAVPVDQSADLLAALQKARGFVLASDHASSARVLEQVEAAIAAATGEGL